MRRGREGVVMMMVGAGGDSVIAVFLVAAVLVCCPWNAGAVGQVEVYHPEEGKHLTEDLKNIYKSSPSLVHFVVM